MRSSQYRAAIENRRWFQLDGILAGSYVRPSKCLHWKITCLPCALSWIMRVTHHCRVLHNHTFENKENIEIVPIYRNKEYSPLKDKTYHWTILSPLKDKTYYHWTMRKAKNEDAVQLAKKDIAPVDRWPQTERLSVQDGGRRIYYTDVLFYSWSFIWLLRSLACRVIFLYKLTAPKLDSGEWTSRTWHRAILSIMCHGFSSWKSLRIVCLGGVTNPTTGRGCSTHE